MKRNRIIGLSLLLDVVLVVIILLFRNNILQGAFRVEQNHLKKTYRLHVTASGIRFISWNRIRLSNVCIQPDSADTLALIQRLEFKPSIWGLLTRQKMFSELSIDSA